MPALAGASRLIDNHTGTVVSLPSGTKTVITLNVPESYTARSLTVYPAKTNMTFNLLLESGENGDYQEVKRFQVNRSNNAIHVGFVPYATVVVSFSPTVGKSLRLNIYRSEEHTHEIQ